MRTTALLTLMAAAFALLTACAAPTPYQPATNGFGYAERRLADDRWRVSFSGNSATARGTVEAHLLRRAAELTVARKADHFIVAERAVEPVTRYRVSDLDGHDHWRRRGAGFGLDSSIATPMTRYDAFLEIVLREGDAPASNPDAYDARSVLATLGE